MEITEVSKVVSLLKISDGFCCSWSEDDNFFVITDEGLDVFHFRPNPKSIVSEFSFHKSFISPLVYYPTEHVNLDLGMLSGLSKDEISTLHYSPILLPQGSFCTHMPILLSKASWSPAGLVGSDNCLLTLLTNSGSVTLWKYQHPQWAVKVDISNYIIEHLKTSNCMDKITQHSMFFGELIKRSKQLTSTSVAWSPSYDRKGALFSFLATTQRSGEVYIHRLTSNISPNANPIVKLENVLHTDLVNVVSTEWMQFNERTLLLILGDVEGRCESFQLQILENFQLNFIKRLPLWCEKDQLSVTSITSGRGRNEKPYVIFTKRSHLIVMSIDSNLQVSEIVTKNLGNLAITDIKKISNDKFIILSYTGEVNLCELVSNNDNNFIIQTERVSTKINLDNNTLYGLCVSNNATIYVLCTTPCKNTERIFGKSRSDISFYRKQEPDIFAKLKNNQLKSLCKQWDLMDSLRISIIKNEYSPSIPDELPKDIPIYEAKLYLWTHIIVSENSGKHNPPIKKHWFLFILISHVKTYVEKLISQYEQNRTLDSFNNLTLSLQVRFLKHYNAQPDQDYGIENVLKKVAKHNKLVLSDVPITCDWCDEKLNGIQCSKGHPRQYCCVTLQEIQNECCLVCPICHSNGHPRLSIDEQICTFCDSQFQPIYTQKVLESNMPNYKVVTSL